MLPTEQPALFARVTDALAEYVKVPASSELEGWWSSCRHLHLVDVERALKAHAADGDDGKRAPRPVDIKRRVGYGAGPSGEGGCGVAGCRYPGVFSDGTNGGGPWYCPWHQEARGGPEASRWADISQRGAAGEAFGKRVDRIHQEGKRSPSLIAIAHAIALRHGDRPWREKTAFSYPGDAEEA